LPAEFSRQEKNMQITPIRQTNSLYQSGISIQPLLEITMNQANAQGVYVHRFDQGDVVARLVAFVGRPPGAETLLPLNGKAAREHIERTSVIVQHEGAWSDWRFAGLSEFEKNRFEGVASIPLRNGGSVVGMANVCRSAAAPWKPSELTFLLSLSLPVAALLIAEEANRSLRKEVDRLAQQLAGRKLVERAKGLLQVRYECSEEQAYLYLRRSSRQRRTPMADVAQEIIQEAEMARHAG
jgi:hypothetical protein